MVRTGITLAVGTLLAAGSALASPLAYVRASSWHNQDSKRSQYHPLRLVDDDPATGWCEGALGPGHGETLTFYFKRKQKIDGLTVTALAKGGRRIERIRLSDGSASVTLELASDITELAFQRPFESDQITMTVEGTGAAPEGGDLPGDVACLADFVLTYRKVPWGGRLERRDLRYSEQADALLGQWNGGALGAPEKFFMFALDGTWTWRFQPMLGGRKQRLAGEFRFRGNRLLLRKGEVGRWTDVNFKMQTVDVDPTEPGAPRGDYDLFSINEALVPMLSDNYNNAEF